MTVLEALLAFTAAAALLTVTPGLDTALVLRTAAVDGARRAVLAGLGIITGCLAWGAAVAVGLGALLAASHLAFQVLKWAGAAYLAWLGLNLLLKPRRSFELPGGPASGEGALTWFRRGLATNLLNPKVGVFYVSFLPQFLPQGVPAGPFLVALAALHGALSLVWFAALILATRPIARALRRPRLLALLDRATGLVFLAFAARLALDRR